MHHPVVLFCAVADDHGDGLAVDAELCAVGLLHFFQEMVTEVVFDEVDGAAAKAATHDAGASDSKATSFVDEEV